MSAKHTCEQTFNEVTKLCGRPAKPYKARCENCRTEIHMALCEKHARTWWHCRGYGWVWLP